MLVLLYSTLSLLRHAHFESGAFDLGLYDQSAWKIPRFLGALNTVRERIIFGDHLVLTLPIFGLGMYLWDDVRSLLIIQVLAIVSSLFPIYFIAKKRLQCEWCALLLSVMYSLFYGIQYGVYFDFHPIMVGVSMLAWLAYFWEYQKTMVFWVLLIFALGTQENMGIAMIGLSFIFVFRPEYRRQAYIVGLVSMIYTYIAIKTVSFFSPIGYEYTPVFPHTLKGIVSSLFDAPEKRQVWLYSYGAFSFIPFFSPGSFLAVLLDLSQYFVTGSGVARMWSPYMHHRAILSVFLVLGTIDVMSFLRSKNIRIAYIVCVLFFISMGMQYVCHFPLNKLTKREYWRESPWMRDTRVLLAMVPDDVSLAVQNNLLPHLSHRREIYLIWPRMHDIASRPCGEKTCWWLDFGGHPTYLVVDTRPDQWLTQILESNDHWNSAISNMEKAGKISLEKNVGTVRMYKIAY
jgi:uncharacterized membrane protein